MEYVNYFTGALTMSYVYRNGFGFAVPAQDAGKELERIRKAHGTLQPRIVVAEAAHEDAVLHPCFEWDDQKAANAHREATARNLIRSVMIINSNQEPEPVYVHVKAAAREDNCYMPLSIVVQARDLFLVSLEELTGYLQSASTSVFALLKYAVEREDKQRAARVRLARKAVDAAIRAVEAI